MGRGCACPDQELIAWPACRRAPWAADPQRARRAMRCVLCLSVAGSSAQPCGTASAHQRSIVARGIGGKVFAISKSQCRNFVQVQQKSALSICSLCLTAFMTTSPSITCCATASALPEAALRMSSAASTISIRFNRPAPACDQLWAISRRNTGTAQRGSAASRRRSSFLMISFYHIQHVTFSDFL